MKFLNNLFNGPYKIAAYGVVALLLVLAIVFGVRSCEKSRENQQNTLVNAGKAEQGQADQKEVITHVQVAKSAVEHSTAADRSVVCSKYDRNCASSGK